MNESIPGAKVYDVHYHAQEDMLYWVQEGIDECYINRAKLGSNHTETLDTINEQNCESEFCVANLYYGFRGGKYAMFIQELW